MLSRAEQSPLSSRTKPLKHAADMEVQLSQAADALGELCELLKEYGPTWYTQAQQERAESTLRLLRKRSKAV
jgi:hypothetical protein